MPSPDPAHASVLNAIYATVSAPETWPQALVAVADHVGATGGMLVFHAMTEARDYQVIGRLREDLSSLYLEQYAHNPFALAARHAPLERALLASSLADMDAVRRTSFHADILTPQRIEEVILVAHPALTRAGSSGGLAFTLTRAQAERRDAVAGRLQALVPHLSRAIDLSMDIGRGLDATRQIGRVLDSLPSAALLLDGRCRILRTNARADSLLAAADGLAAKAGDGAQLAADRTLENRDLARMLARAVSVAAGEVAAFQTGLRISRPSGKPALIVVVTPLPPPAFALWEAVERGARALVQVIDPQAPVVTQAEILKAAAGLTAAETRVVALIAEGRAAPEVARAMGLSPATVRTHLARCFDKTGAHSQVSLTRLLASLSG